MKQIRQHTDHSNTGMTRQIWRHWCIYKVLKFSVSKWHTDVWKWEHVTESFKLVSGEYTCEIFLDNKTCTYPVAYISLYLVATACTACTQWKIGGEEVVKGVDQNLPIFFTGQSTPLTRRPRGAWPKSGGGALSRRGYTQLS